MAPDKSGYPDNIFLFLQEIMPGTSNEYPQHMFLWRNKKNVTTLPVKPELFSVKERLCISHVIISVHSLLILCYSIFSKGDFDEFIAHMRGLLNIYSLSGDK